jgi:hypothetical protein
MKKVILFSAVIFALAVPSFAFFHLGVNAGYAYANLDDVNNNYKTGKQMIESNGAGTAKLNTLGSAIFANADLDLGLMPFLNIGPRVGLEYVLPVTNEFNYTGPGAGIPYSGTIDEKQTTSLFLVPLELGLNTNLGIPFLPLSVTLGAYAGYGLAFATIETKLDAGSLSTNYTIPYNGGGFMGDLSGAVEWSFLPFMTLSLNAGYRYALISNLDVTKKITLPDGTVVVDSSEELKNYEGSKMKTNFSGFLLGLGLNIRF